MPCALFPSGLNAAVSTFWPILPTLPLLKLRFLFLFPRLYVLCLLLFPNNLPSFLLLILLLLLLLLLPRLPLLPLLLLLLLPIMILLWFVLRILQMQIYGHLTFYELLVPF